MLRVFVNALSAGNRSGTGRYAGELCRALSQLAADPASRDDARVAVVIEESHPLCEELESSGAVEVIAQPARSPLARTLWETLRLRALARRARADVFHAPAFIAPRLPCPSVVTLHDCAFLRYGETIRPLWRYYYRRAIPRSACAAAFVAVDSESTRRDAIDLMRLAPAKVRVVPLGVGEQFFVRAVDPTVERRVRHAIGVEGPFLLTAGTIEPRKNLDTLIRAYARLRTLDAAAPPLVIAGRAGWMSSQLEAVARDAGVADRVRFPGFIADADLPALLALAAVFVCVSLYEGFGLPPLEAMAAGAPVIVSSTSSLPEVVGDAGVLVAPTDETAIARAMRSLLRDEAQRAHLIRAGRDRAREYTWDRAARAMLALYREAAAQGRSFGKGPSV